MSCNVTERVLRDAAAGKETSPAAVDFVARTCPCAVCKGRRAKPLQPCWRCGAVGRDGSYARGIRICADCREGRTDIDRGGDGR